MALYVVIGENPYYKRGTYVEDLVDPTEYDPAFEVDVPMQTVQPVRCEVREGRLNPVGNYGIALPLQMVRAHLLRIQRKGIDKTW